MTSQRIESIWIRTGGYGRFIFLKKTFRHYRTVKNAGTARMQKVQSIMLFKKNDDWKDAYSNKLHVSS